MRSLFIKIKLHFIIEKIKKLKKDAASPFYTEVIY